ncbi:hypothetical protein [Photobacterium sp.]|uniref:hypothetical protein n=1 Tax=Photobacterium sp. TaxID=660 RepID=UPI00299E5925|nr:hypothetical protein [Photobacterium sp.]MDX1301469.1 hypothetical protein [Photobacterium sp.]
MKIALAILLAFAAVPASASDFRMTIPLASKHFFCANDPCVKLNESNLGIGAEYAGYGVISFKNSYSRQSVAVYKAFEYDANPYLGFGIRLGGATGYKAESGMDVVPLAQPYLRILPMTHFSLNLGIVPVGLIDAKNYNAVVTLDSQIRF